MSILKNEGMPGLYKGFGISIFGTIASTFSYFYIYASLRKRVVERTIGNLGTGTELLVGAAAGALCQLIVLPIAVVTTRYSFCLI